MDPEVKAKAEVAAALDALDKNAVNRVLRWAAERYGLALATPLTKAKPDAGAKGVLSEDEGSLY